MHTFIHETCVLRRNLSFYVLRLLLQRRVLHPIFRGREVPGDGVQSNSADI
jgi:hypothetical protein